MEPSDATAIADTLKATSREVRDGPIRGLLVVTARELRKAAQHSADDCRIMPIGQLRSGMRIIDLEGATGEILGIIPKQNGAIALKLVVDESIVDYRTGELTREKWVEYAGSWSPVIADFRDPDEPAAAPAEEISDPRADESPS